MISRRQAIWGALLLAGGLLLALAPDNRPGDDAEPVPAPLRPPGPQAAAGGRGAAAATAETVQRLQPRLAVPDASAGAERLWRGRGVVAAAVPPPPRLAVQAPPPPPPEPAPAAPAPPPLPFRLLGRYADNARSGVVLQGADGQVQIAHAGDQLGTLYRVETLAGNVMVLTYLPLNLTQTLDIGIAR